MTVQNVQEFIAKLEGLNPLDGYAYEKALHAFMTVKQLPFLILEMTDPFHVFRTENSTSAGNQGFALPAMPTMKLWLYSLPRIIKRQPSVVCMLCCHGVFVRSVQVAECLFYIGLFEMLQLSFTSHFE